MAGAEKARMTKTSCMNNQTLGISDGDHVAAQSGEGGGLEEKS